MTKSQLLDLQLALLTHGRRPIDLVHYFQHFIIPLIFNNIVLLLSGMATISSYIFLLCHQLFIPGSVIDISKKLKFKYFFLLAKRIFRKK